MLLSPVSTFRLHQLSTGDDVTSKSYHDLLPPTGFTALTAVPTKSSKYYQYLFTRVYLTTSQFKMLLGYSSYRNLSNIYSSGPKNLACNL